MRARSEHAVAERDVTRGGTREAHRQHNLVEHGHDPAHGAHEVLAVSSPALGTRPLDGGDEAGQDVGQQVGHGRCGDVLGGEHVLHALDLATLKVFRREALAARKADGGLGGVAVGIEGDLGRRALVLFHERLGGVGHAIGHDDQTARARVDFHGIEGNARVGEGGGHHLLELLVRGVQVERGDFLDADLECERMLFGHVTPPSFRRRMPRHPRLRQPPWRCRTRSTP